MRTKFAAWWFPETHDQARAIELVRWWLVVALAMHPLHAIVSPADASALAEGLAGRGCPFPLAVAWFALGVQLVASIALAIRRLVVAGAIASMTVVGGGIGALYAPRWYVVGGLAEDGHPGVEFNALLLACLAAVLWTYAPRRGRPAERRATAVGGMELVRVASALSLLAHGYGPFVLRDLAGMHAWGEAMSRDGFPYGVALVWSIKGVELSCALLRLFRRFVVPACFGHLSYLVPALYLEHRLHWFDVGPGENGIEFPMTIVVCTAACILTYWPRPNPARARAPASTRAASIA